MTDPIQSDSSSRAEPSVAVIVPPLAPKKTGRKLERRLVLEIAPYIPTYETYCINKAYRNLKNRETLKEKQKAITSSTTTLMNASVESSEMEVDTEDVTDQTSSRVYCPIFFDNTRLKPAFAQTGKLASVLSSQLIKLDRTICTLYVQELSNQLVTVQTNCTVDHWLDNFRNNVAKATGDTQSQTGVDIALYVETEAIPQLRIKLDAILQAANNSWPLFNVHFLIPHENALKKKESNPKQTERSAPSSLTNVNKKKSEKVVPVLTNKPTTISAPVTVNSKPKKVITFNRFEVLSDEPPLTISSSLSSYSYLSLPPPLFQSQKPLNAKETLPSTRLPNSTKKGKKKRTNQRRSKKVMFKVFEDLTEADYPFLYKDRKGSKVINMTKLKLPKDIEQFLNRGHKFIPSLKPLLSSLLSSFDRTASDLSRIHKDKFEVSKLCLAAITECHRESLIEKFECLYRDKRDALRHHNMMLSSISNWLVSNNLVTRQADKNLGTVIIHRETYNKEANKHLNDKNTYAKIIMPPLRYLLDTFYRMCEMDLRPLFENAREYSCFMKKIRPNALDLKIPEFYVMPKLHKKRFASRPIVGNYSSITTNSSKYLAKELNILKRKYSWISDGTLSTVNRLERLFITNPNCLLVTFDVVSLYTNINNNEGTERVTQLVSDMKQRKIVNRLLKFVLNTSFFKYDETVYKQTNGVAMGTNMAPPYADLFIASFECLIFDRYPKLKESWNRFIDDGFFVWNESREELDSLMTYMNQLTSSLEFTFEIHNEYCSFLDLMIYKGPHFKDTGKLSLKNYSKPSSTHLYTDPSSDYPLHYRVSWITGENIRLLRTCSTRLEFDKCIDSFKKYLRLSGYSNSLINEYIIHPFERRMFFLEQSFYANSNRPSSSTIVEHHAGWLLVKESIRKLNSVFTAQCGRKKIPIDHSFMIKQGKQLSTTTNKANKLGLQRSSLKRVSSAIADTLHIMKRSRFNPDSEKNVRNIHCVNKEFKPD
jgi:hypothetical protein